MKYYYDCPIKAAYMTKYFNMEYSSDSEFNAEPRRLEIDTSVDKFYIASGYSLSLLKPTIRDTVILTDGRILALYMEDAGKFYGVPEQLQKPRFIKDNEWIPAKNIKTILLRDFKPFISPLKQPA